jgi:hypothetical protein
MNLLGQVAVVAGDTVYMYVSISGVAGRVTKDFDL